MLNDIAKNKIYVNLEGISFTGKSSCGQSGELSGRLMTTTVPTLYIMLNQHLFGTTKNSIKGRTLHSYIPNTIDALQ